MISKKKGKLDFLQDIYSVCFWSWNDYIDKDEIRQQMQEIADRLFSGVIVHSRCGLRIPYMGKEWFDLYSVVIEEAKRLQLEIWIYDEDGWPSGFAGGKVTALGEDFWIKNISFSKGNTEPEKEIIAAYRKGNECYYSIPPEKSTQMDLVCYYNTDKNYVDLLSKDTVKAFIDSTYEKYKSHFGEYFGTVIKGFFTDEPQIKTYPWSKALNEAWEKLYGSDIREDLYMLIEESGEWQKFRYRFRTLANELFVNSFTKQLSAWCEKNNLMLTGHLSEEDGLFSQMGTNGGVMRHYAVMQLPGIDCLGRRIASPILAKQAASITNQLGKVGVLCEVFGCAGWDITFHELFYYWGRLSALGITKPCFHLVAYSVVGRRKRDYPAFFSYQEPWWNQFSEVMKYINGLNQLMSEGTREVDTLIIAPTDSVSAEYINDYKRADHSMNDSCEYRMLLENLLDLQLDCELGDETIISEYGFIKDGAFCIGNAAYKQVFVSETSTLKQKTVTLLEQFVLSGGTLVYLTQKPKLVDLMPGNVPPGIVVQNRKALLEKLLKRFRVQRPVRIYDVGSDHLRQGAVIHTRTLNHGKRIHIWSGADFSSGISVVSVSVNSSKKYTAFLIDPHNGKKSCLKSIKSGDTLLIDVELPRCSNTVIEVSEEDLSLPVMIPRTTLAQIIRDVRVELCDNNALTIDYAKISVNKQPYSERQPIIKAIDCLYQELKIHDTDLLIPIDIKYEFYCNKRLNTKDISVAVEDRSLSNIKINGTAISGKRVGYWIDKGIGIYEIGDLLHSGYNEIILTYHTYGGSYDTSILNGFENERNRFYYSFEPDSIYILGDFDVEVTDPIYYNGSCCIPNQDFKLVPSQTKKMGSVTQQGAWFYRGNIKYSFDIELSDNYDHVYLELKNVRAIAAQIQVDGRCKIDILLSEKLDIVDYLKTGLNKIELILFGHNRNLLGPHHHIKRNVAMVGPSTFMGAVGFEDFVSPELTEVSRWTDSYSFVPFGCDEIRIICANDHPPSEYAIF